MLSGPENVFRLGLIAVCLLLGFTLGPGSATLGAAQHGAGCGCGPGTGVRAGAVRIVAGAGWLIERPGAQMSITMSCCAPSCPAAAGVGWCALRCSGPAGGAALSGAAAGGIGLADCPALAALAVERGLGLLHWPQGVVLGATLAGVVFGLLFLFTGSLWVPLAAHYVLNVTQLLLAQITRAQPLR